MTGPILVHEVERAEKTLLHIVQNEYFSQEIKCLKGPNGQVSQKSKLFRLQPFLDKSGLLRVGGRLKNAASLEIFQKYPLIIPAKSTFTKLLLRNEHERLCHSGPQTVLASIRQRYWPLNARNTIRGIIFKCLRCFRQRPIMVQPIMGDLPSDRVEPSRAFKISGVDFWGPVMLKSSLRKNAPLKKAYVSVFVCFSTKAVHIELVNGLSTQDFI
ncbi:uncharacterized protein LOC126902008 [Daktulosphaira vitifoliae]|uniref:uncharacterized protein LOC126902008 n=1 Tax=Daktulosphaira vitifoliae TaxID=58002 RepID=UPI0021A9CE82|nr:uncharacterized protein LOC126902008 [Daktulosphaira vitifoliae]